MHIHELHSFFLNTELSTAKRGQSSFLVQQKMSSALRRAIPRQRGLAELNDSERAAPSVAKQQCGYQRVIDCQSGFAFSWTPCIMQFINDSLEIVFTHVAGPK